MHENKTEKLLKIIAELIEAAAKHKGKGNKMLEDKGSCAFVEHQNFSRLVVHVDKEIYARFKEIRLFEEKSNMEFLPHFPGKFSATKYGDVHTGIIHWL